MGVILMEHKFNLKERHLRKSKLALYVFAEGHQVDWAQACILRFEPNPTSTKYEEMGSGSVFQQFYQSAQFGDISYLVPLNREGTKM